MMRKKEKIVTFLRWGWQKFSVIGIVVLISLLASTLVLASTEAPYSIAWWTIDGGGVTALTGGTYSLGGTVGQMDTGNMSGGSYSLSGGFWGGIKPSFVVNLPLVIR